MGAELMGGDLPPPILQFCLSSQTCLSGGLPSPCHFGAPEIILLLKGTARGDWNITRIPLSVCVCVHVRTIYV